MIAISNHKKVSFFIFTILSIIALAIQSQHTTKKTDPIATPQQRTKKQQRALAAYNTISQFYAVEISLVQLTKPFSSEANKTKLKEEILYKHDAHNKTARR